MSLARRAAAEFVGTLFLLMVVVGSGIMGERLAQGNMAIALLANSIATAAGLFAIIVAVHPVSGAHLNPCVSILAWHEGAISAAEAALYSVMQILGAAIGVLLAHVMFSLPAFALGTKDRSTAGEFVAEIVATAGLLAVIRLARTHGVAATAAAIACYIGSAYWFTSSTSFANPAVTLARALTDSFAAIRPGDVPAFIGAQLIGTALVILVARLEARKRPG
jgi:glycerol uptake facilitator-like aquaporin